MAGKEDRIVKCLRCYTCMAERPVTFTRRCAVNPLIGREIEGMEVLPARQSKKVMVVGAGVAGLKAAVTPEYVEQEGVDALILAVGSTPLVPPIPGIDGDNVIIVNDYYLHKDKVADSVVGLGGGLAGCECAIHLGMEGKKVEHHQGHLRGLSRRPGYLATHGTCVPVSPKSVSNVSFVSRFFCITAGVKFPINI